MKTQYSPEAAGDLARLRKLMEVKNPHAAKRAAVKILTGIEKLKAFPEIGLLVQHSPKPEKVRDLLVSHYTVRYLIRQDTIYILRVWHVKEAEKATLFPM